MSDWSKNALDSANENMSDKKPDNAVSPCPQEPIYVSYPEVESPPEYDSFFEVISGEDSDTTLQDEETD